MSHGSVMMDGRFNGKIFRELILISRLGYLLEIQRSIRFYEYLGTL